MNRGHEWIGYAIAAFGIAATTPVLAAGTLEDAADMAEVFVYGRESQYRGSPEGDLDPDQYDAMAKARSESDEPMAENVEVEGVEILEAEGDRAVGPRDVQEQAFAEAPADECAFAPRRRAMAGNDATGSR